MQCIFPAPAMVTVPIVGCDQLFPVHRIYCVGRNYVEHAKEMGESGREPPFFFMKPADAVLPVAHGDVGMMPYPPKTQELHHEIELVVALGSGGQDIPTTEALQHVFGYAVGLDMTRRDLQAEAKKQGRPWCTSKGFDYSAPISAIQPFTKTGAIDHGAIHLTVNAIPRQQGDINQLIWNVAETIAYLSNYFMLQTGDLIFTGTPAGVATVARGDLLVGSIDNVGELKVRLV